MKSYTNYTLLGTRVGIEVELLAPPGQSRYDLAEAVATRFRGTVLPTSSVVHDGLTSHGEPRYSMRPAFDVIDRVGQRVARIVDDITINQDLDGSAHSRPGWGRLISADCELLRWLSTKARITEPVRAWLAPLTLSHNATIERVAGGSWVAVDDAGHVLALATGLPGERERPAEVISPPLTGGHRAWLDAVLGAAADQGFALPTEAAVHLHFDADAFTNVASFAALVEGFVLERQALRQLVGTNESCRALGPWPNALIEAVRSPDFADLAWPQAVRQLDRVRLSKHCDLNILGVLNRGAQQTIEFRFFPGSMDAAQIMDWAKLASACLDRWAALSNRGSPPLSSMPNSAHHEFTTIHQSS